MEPNFHVMDNNIPKILFLEKSDIFHFSPKGTVHPKNQFPEQKYKRHKYKIIVLFSLTCWSQKVFIERIF